MTIEQKDTIAHPSILEQLLHNAALRYIIQDGRSMTFHLGKLGYFEFGEQYYETVNHAREVSGCEANVDYLGLPWVTSRPIHLNSVIHLCTSLRTDSGDQPIVVYSRYQTFSSDCTQLAI